MTRAEYLDWIQNISHNLAKEKYPDNQQLQLIYAMGLCQRALADLCYDDSNNTYKVNSMYKRNTTQATEPYKSKRKQ